MKIGIPTVVGLLTCFAFAYSPDVIVLKTEGWTTPDYAASGKPREQFLQAATNHIINSMSWEKDPITPLRVRNPDGIAFPIPKEMKPRLNELRKKNPYDCTSRKFGPVRPDWLALELRQNPYKSKGITSWEELAKKLGVPESESDPRWKRFLLGNGHNGEQQESRISKGERGVLRATSSEGREVWMTIDSRHIPKIEGKMNPFNLRAKFPFEAASEVIFERPNGFDDYILMAVDNEQKPPRMELQPLAPTNFVVNNFRERYPLTAWEQKHLPSYRSRVSFAREFTVEPLPGEPEHIYIGDCATCHRGGMIGPQRGSRHTLVSVQAQLDARPALVRALAADFARSFDGLQAEVESLEAERKRLKDSFMPADQYEKNVEASSTRYLNALKKAEAFFPDPRNPDAPVPIIPDLAQIYSEPLSLEKLASEVGVTSKEMQDLLDREPNLAKRMRRYQEVPKPPYQYDRGEVETFYCAMRVALGKEKSLSAEELRQHKLPTTPGNGHAPF